MNARHPQTLAATPSRTGSSTTPRRWLGSAAAVASAATAALGAVWLARPAWNPHGPGGDLDSILGNVVSPGGAAIVQLVVGLVGLVLAGAALTTTARPGRRWPSWLVPVGGFLAAVTAFGLLGMGVIVGLGYATAFVVPVGLAILVFGLLRLGGRARWGTLVVLAAVLAVGLLTGVLTPEAWGLTGLLGDFVRQAPRQLAAPFTLTASALVWAVLGLQAATANGRLERAGSWVLRHRTAITVTAAIGPLPYAVQRLSWLTDWPVLVPADLTPEMRLWGLMLSFGGWAGFVLTLGLIQRWGEVFPRWMPGFAGRPVPVWFAAAPGSVVAAGLTVSAAPMLVTFGEEGLVDGLVSALVFPFWLWGPALGLAVWGYVLHRRRALLSTPAPGRDVRRPRQPAPSRRRSGSTR